MLRVGIMLDSYTSSAWVARVIEEIQSSGFARVELVILDHDPAQSRSAAKTAFGSRWKSTLFRLYEHWDYRRNKAKHDALAPTDVSSLLNGVPSISVQPVHDRIPEPQLAEIRSHALDVLIRFGFSALQGGIPGAARYGVWSFHHGDHPEDRSSPPLLRELIEKNPVSGSTLQVHTNSPDGSRVIYQSYASTDQISLYASRNPIYWKTAEFALRRLRDLHTRGIEHLHSVSREQETVTRGKKRTPSSLQTIGFIGRHLSRWLQARVAPLRPGSRTKWYLAIRRRTAAHRFDDPAGYRLIPCPGDCFYADPFLFEKDGRTVLFFEDFRYAEGRAVISCCELDPDGTPGPPVEVLRRPYHLSYPFVFEYEGEIYMMPETKENQTVELYRATSFPTTWASEGALLSGIYAVDATIQKIDGKFWMFAGISNGKFSNSDELSLFYADALKGPWTPHPANPVLSDVRRSRPAGMLFYEKGRLIRPSQDCGKAYGYALGFSEVLKLSETEYEERPIARLDPSQVTDCIGTHTYNRTEQFEIVDRTLPAGIAKRIRED